MSVDNCNEGCLPVSVQEHCRKNMATQNTKPMATRVSGRNMPDDCLTSDSSRGSGEEILPCEAAWLWSLVMAARVALLLLFLQGLSSTQVPHSPRIPMLRCLAHVRTHPFTYPFVHIFIHESVILSNPFISSTFSFHNHSKEAITAWMCVYAVGPWEAEEDFEDRER